MGGNLLALLKQEYNICTTFSHTYRNPFNCVNSIFGCHRDIDWSRQSQSRWQVIYSEDKRAREGGSDV